MVHVCEQELHRLESHRDRFYATGPNLPVELKAALSREIGAKEGFAFIAEEDGHLVGVATGRVVSAPPVYDPGGKVGLVEFFEVAGSVHWPSVGTALLQPIDEALAREGGVLARVECRTVDKRKHRWLLAQGFTVASDWLYRDVSLPLGDADGIRLAEPADVPAMVALFEENRERYQTYQPVFWRKAADSAQRQTPYLKSLIEGKAQIVLVHASGGKIDGAIVTDPNAFTPFFDLRGRWCSTDDFAVADEAAWETVGAGLLADAVRRSGKKGAETAQVICADGDHAKLRLLRRLGFAQGHAWLVRGVAPRR